MSALMGGGLTSVKFPAPGSSYAGTITSIEERQQTAFNTGEPLVWSDGKPRMQTVCGVIDHSGESAALYIKGAMTAAVRDAVRASGAADLAVGSFIRVTHTHSAEPKQHGMPGAKQYQAEYRPPANAPAGYDEPPEW